MTMEPESEQDFIVVDALDLNDGLPTPLTHKELEKLQTWLSPTDYAGDDSEFAKHSAAHLSGTGTWVDETTPYRQWLSSETDGILWIRGAPGSGKSVMAARMITMLRNTGNPVLYFFFRAIVDANNSEAAALRDWLHQLLPHSISLQLELLSCETGERDVRNMDCADLWRYVMIGLADTSRCFIVVDALDEAAEGSRFASNLAEMASARPRDVKVVATSRPVPRIQEPLQRAGAQQLRMDEQRVDVDIAAYVQHQLQGSNVPSGLHQKVKDAVPGKANGLFLYARLAMDALSAPGVDAETALASLQNGLNVLYTTLLRESAEKAGISAELQKNILQFVTHATRPLRLLELAECLAYFGEFGCPQDIKQAKDLIRASCGNLLEILPNETISILHHSLTEFLTRESTSDAADQYSALRSDEAHLHLALACMSYIKEKFLMKESFDTSPEELRRWQQARDNRIPSHKTGSADLPRLILQGFARYACLNWQTHVSKAMGCGQDEARIVELLDYFALKNQGSLLYALWPGSERDALQVKTPLAVAVCFELRSFAEAVLGRDQVDYTQIAEKELLLCERACSLGWRRVVQMLLDSKSINVNRWNVGETTLSSPLIAAAYSGNAQVVQLLLEHGADANFWEATPPEKVMGSFLVYGDAQPYPLQAAANSLEITQLLSPLVTCALHVSAGLGTAIELHQNIDVVQALCQHALLDVNRPCYGRDTPIILASKVSDDKSVQHLLGLGADPNLCPPKFLETNDISEPLRAIDNWAQGTRRCPDAQVAETLRLLISAGVDINVKGCNGRTPLHLASDALRTKLLLAAGADDTVANDDGETPLLREPIDAEQFEVLLKRAASAEKAQATVTVTAESSIVMRAIKTLHPKAAIRLIEAGLTAAATDEDGNTTLHYAAAIYTTRTSCDRFVRIITKRMLKAMERDNADLVKLLCRSGVSINARNAKGQTPLHLVARGPDGWDEQERQRREGQGGFIYQSIVWDAMLDLGADIHAECNDGETPLFAFARQSGLRREVNLNSLQWMMDHGASAAATDHKGRNLFFVCCFDPSFGNECTFGAIAELGVDPKHIDDDGNTMYAAALQQGNISKDVFDKLVEAGVDINLANHQGRTPLHIFSARSIPDVPEWEYAPPHDPLSICSKDDINKQDKDGIRPLQLAIAHNEKVAIWLLERGADACVATATSENLFHLTAKYGRAALVASVAEAILAQAGQQKLRELVNAADAAGRSPLYYACQSGRAESVRALLIYGAEENAAAALAGCAMIESSVAWAASPTLNPDSMKVSDVFDSYPVALDEVLHILTSWNIPGLVLDHAVETAARHGHAHSVGKLLELRAQLGHADSESWSQAVYSCRETLKHIRSQYCISGPAPLAAIPAKFNFYLSKREHTFAMDMVFDQELLRQRGSGYTLLHDLARGGFTAMLSKLLTPRRLALLEEGRLQRPKGEPSDTLLMAACRRQEPNIGTIRLLVEDFHVDVNAQAEGPAEDDKDMSKWQYWNRERTSPTEQLETALHVLAKGNREWHGSWAIPYLCARGARANVLDRCDTSPLENALDERLRKQLDSASVIRALLKSGATTQCLAPNKLSAFLLGKYDAGIFQLLLSSTEAPDSSALMGAIRGDDEESIQRLLKQNVDPSQPQLCADWDTTSHEAIQHMTIWPPLFWAYCRRFHLDGLQQKEPEHQLAQQAGGSFSQAALEKNQRIIDMLLASGADPNAELQHLTHHENAEPRKMSMIPEIMRRYRAERNTSAPYNSAVISLLQHPNLRDLNTHLLGAIKQVLPDCFEALLGNGADIMARDAKGRTALHALVKCSSTRGRPDSKAWDTLFQQAELVNGASNDGTYPIHRAVWHPPFITRLIAAGAQPWVADGRGQNVLHLVSQSGNATKRVDALQSLLSLPGAVAALHARSDDDSQSTPVERLFSTGRSNYDDGEKEDEEFWTIASKPAFDMVEAAGADLHALNNTGQSLLHVAATTNSSLTFHYLLDRGLDPRLEDHAQRTPLDIAAECNAQLILNLFNQSSTST